MATPDPQKFADDWVHAWIAHDVEAALEHFHETSCSRHRWRPVCYRTPAAWCGELVNEVLTFDGELVREGHGTYLG
jgi:hypothetical protein